ncbi:MAG: hypothetical protein J7J92_02400, partial [Candidatus Aenigmarchaeota archaeon]|nr:hypothetical protein [Candidatus Aenigmarchaeota archaeon]
MKTTIAGGDTASHYYPAKYMKEYLLPNGQIKGWFPDWFAGLPIFQFYFPLPFVLIAMLSYLIPLEISFKLVTVLGIFLLPICTYISLKYMGFKKNERLLGALFTLIAIFIQNNSMWGGNASSMLAGEFCYSISLSLAILFLGTIYSGLKNEKHIILNSLLLSAIVLSHLYPALIAVSAPVLFLALTKNLKKNKIAYLSKVYLLGFFLTAFWSIPFALDLNLVTVTMHWPVKEFSTLVPKELIIFFLVAFVGIFKGAKKGIKNDLFLASAIFSSLFFALFPIDMVLNIRFVPFLYLFIVIFAGVVIGRVVNKIKRNGKILTIFILIIIILWLFSYITYLPHWIKWNYEGFESKEQWPELKEFFDYLRLLPPGRVMHEYNKKHNSFGTPRTLESIPLFTGKPVIEGLYMESAVSTPFAYVLQAEVSETPSCPVYGLYCGSLNLTKAAKHLRMFGVKYYIATTETTREEAIKSKDFKLLREFPSIELYVFSVVNGGKIVEPLKYEPVYFETNNWKEISLDWFKKLKDVYLIFDKVPEIKKVNNIENLPKEKIRDCFVQEDVKNERIEIYTDCINQPVLVKMSYHPNWKAYGAKGPYLVSPSFMLIYPTENNVKLVYENSWYS